VPMFARTATTSGKNTTIWHAKHLHALPAQAALKPAQTANTFIGIAP
jgi:hypothetical protein